MGGFQNGIPLSGLVVLQFSSWDLLSFVDYLYTYLRWAYYLDIFFYRIWKVLAVQLAIVWPSIIYSVSLLSGKLLFSFVHILEICIYTLYYLGFRFWLIMREILAVELNQILAEYCKEGFIIYPHVHNVTLWFFIMCWARGNVKWPWIFSLVRSWRRMAIRFVFASKTLVYKHLS